MRADRVTLPHTMVAWNISHYPATLNSIEFARTMIAERIVAKQPWAVLLDSLLQRSSIDVVEGILEVQLRGRYLQIITISKGIKMITCQHCGVISTPAGMAQAS